MNSTDCEYFCASPPLDSARDSLAVFGIRLSRSKTFISKNGYQPNKKHPGPQTEKGRHGCLRPARGSDRICFPVEMQLLWSLSSGTQPVPAFCGREYPGPPPLVTVSYEIKPVPTNGRGRNNLPGGMEVRRWKANYSAICFQGAIGWLLFR